MIYIVLREAILLVGHVHKGKVEETSGCVFSVLVKIILPNIVQKVMCLEKSMQDILSRRKHCLAKHLHVRHYIPFFRRQRWWTIVLFG